MHLGYGKRLVFEQNPSHFENRSWMVMDRGMVGRDGDFRIDIFQVCTFVFDDAIATTCQRADQSFFRD